MFHRFLYYDHPPERDITVIYRHLYLYTLFMFEVTALKLVVVFTSIQITIVMWMVKLVLVY